MRLSQVVRSGPNQYICEENALKFLEEKLEDFKNPVVITGKKSWNAFLEFGSVPSQWPVLTYDHTASDKNIAELAKKAAHADMIVGIGGGKVLDTAKGVAELLNIEVTLVPTLAGTCAGFTPLSAIYDENGQFSHVAYYKRSAYLTLIDLRIILHSPVEYLLGGIGDSLAKWYESEGITRNQHSLPVMVKLGLSSAKIIYEGILRYSEQAVKDHAEKKLSAAFKNIVEIIIGVAGTVGGFAGEYGRMAGAHAIHNGLSFLPETHDILHGSKVAYGILVQLAALQQFAEIKQLLPLYKKLGFPYNLNTLHVTGGREEAIAKVSAYAARKEESFILLGNFTKDNIASAMRAVEELAVQEVSIQ
ncbi:iron-containing alcohol dehydrogenase family protein [Bacillus ginsengihumi]|uniref:Iron-containing alcohol dehydrogenase family protein n=1 Tax=Heyndrickxia ginsengihumi TaxID=363870 RepID=A0A6M0P621_9BACI|nr:iron-containing alcohol dehydrogenase family protein [Heyndrickxia ginsengihumi]MBE6185174.1 iron-containing alcohol dehydrogenase family protein [Bacillus sp. (in: firmicutes)]NEY19923.1 iron-containing alcohol dehydrogenase family protein [Heyndrickxia ginsengihumi]